MKAFQTILIITAFLSAWAPAAKAVEIKSLDFNSGKDQGNLTIKFEGELKEYPELRVANSTIQVLIPDSKVRREINKKVSFATKEKDTSLNASQHANNSSRIKAVFPFDMNKHRDKVSLMIKDNKIELNFPRIEVQAPAVKSASVAATTGTKKAIEKKAKAKNVKKEYLNEDYLNSLLKVEKKEKVVAGKVIRPKKNEDSVKTILAAPAKASKSSFSMVEYAGKFVAFLAVVLLMFYAIVTLMKKGFIKKGKLGFLNKTEQIQVLSQTYIAPKKSLMIVRAHNQVFLVSNTDSGIHPISEIKDVAGFIKDGERKIAGDNFDDSLGNASANEGNDEKVKLKEDITQSNKQSSLSDFIGVKDKVKFSDEIKKKVKSLKPLH